MPMFATMLPMLTPAFGDSRHAGDSAGLVAAWRSPPASDHGGTGRRSGRHEGNCNTRGLTTEGETLINALMDHRMIIDVDHTDTPMFDDILDIAEDRNYPGIVTGHTGLIGGSKTRAELGVGVQGVRQQHDRRQQDRCAGPARD